MGKIKDIAGQKFNHLTAIKHQGHGYWLFRCDCGNEVVRYQNNVTRGVTKSCGCLRTSIRNDLTGRRFGRLLVFSYEGNRKWKCRCDCGNEKIVEGGSLIGGNTQSCGCLHAEHVKAMRVCKHNATGTSTYIRWRSMKSRCYNPNDVGYANYGGRGIKVCDRWRDSFENFLADMGAVPSKAYSLDRIDTNGDYTPENCRWATAKEQSNNKRNNVRYTFFGRTQTLPQWCRELNFNFNLARRRAWRGLTAFEEIFAPNQGVKKVNKYSEHGDLICTYPSVKSAAKENGVCVDYIIDRCKHKIANPGKYRFEYAN